MSSILKAMSRSNSASNLHSNPHSRSSSPRLATPEQSGDEGEDGNHLKVHRKSTPKMSLAHSHTTGKPIAEHLKDVASQIMAKMRKEKAEHPHEKDSEAHQIFRSYPGHAARRSLADRPSDLNQDVKQAKKDAQKSGIGSLDPVHEHEELPGIQSPGATGVIFVMDRAFANGFSYDSPSWANFGQGAPEVGHIEGASTRPTVFDLEAMGEGVNEYAPTTGVKELREAVANYYNETYRKGKKSQYTYENVCIVPGGRSGLTRVAAVMGDVLVGFSLPEYTAYDQMLSVFKRMVPIPMALSPDNHYKLDASVLESNIRGMGLSAFVVSNPKNPTGQVIEGEELKQLLALGKREQVSLILDEFYSWYNYEGKLGSTLSAAEYVEDVNGDSVILIDGLTKNWRLPGWRCCWVVAPKQVVSALSQSGSFLDGGASHPIQKAAIPMLDLEWTKNDRIALQKHFRAKREHVLKRLDRMGLKVKVEPKYTFYIWLDLSNLPEPINSGLVFFEELLKEKCIVVPGIFFDINPSHRRNLFSSPAHHFVRLSFGPPLEQLDKGLDAIERVLHNAHDLLHSMGTLERMGTNLAPVDPGAVVRDSGSA